MRMGEEKEIFTEAERVNPSPPLSRGFFNETECEGNEKVPNIHKGSASGNVREMEPILSPDKEEE